ncbi:hypothetical protein G7Z17_g10636 [Cylindrodendrum hubeiense]|uniref:Uncharacterized protein n=1 Tax=Cylindrodendrum hubeiense TaxID=595255 RepID=A0A9P5GXC5_9HYPO|nr:hypothetical protein G7Z17_g10636 [Cylindrodendrum hubeiense]
MDVRPQLIDFTLPSLSLPWPAVAPDLSLDGAGRLRPLRPRCSVGPDAASCTSGHSGADMDGAGAWRRPPRGWPKEDAKEDGGATGTGNEAALGAEVEA